MATLKDMCALPGMSQMCQDNTHIVIGTCIGLMLLSTFAVLLRLASRRVSTLSFWWDDAVMISSLVSDLHFSPHGFQFGLSDTQVVGGVVCVFRTDACWYEQPYSHADFPLWIQDPYSLLPPDARNGVGRHFETVPQASVVLLFKVSPQFPDPQ